MTINPRFNWADIHIHPGCILAFSNDPSIPDQYWTLTRTVDPHDNPVWRVKTGDRNYTVPSINPLDVVMKHFNTDLVQYGDDQAPAPLDDMDEALELLRSPVYPTVGLRSEFIYTPVTGDRLFTRIHPRLYYRKYKNNSYHIVSPHGLTITIPAAEKGYYCRDQVKSWISNYVCSNPKDQLVAWDVNGTIHVFGPDFHVHSLVHLLALATKSIGREEVMSNALFSMASRNLASISDGKVSLYQTIDGPELSSPLYNEIESLCKIPYGDKWAVIEESSKETWSWPL